MFSPITANGRKRKTVNIAINFANLCNLFTQKRSVLHFGTDLLRSCIFSPGVFFDYSDADIEVLDFITICKNRTANIDFYALGSG